MKLKFIVAGLMVAASFGASAANQSVVLTETPVLLTDNTFAAQSNLFGVFNGGSDVHGHYDLISFTGLAAGVYNIGVTVSGQNVAFNDQFSNLNGALGEYSVSGTKNQFRFFGVDFTGTSPFALKLYGTRDSLSSAGIYTGNVTVSAVPEPETYGMLLAGLGLMGFIARRKQAKKAA